MFANPNFISQENINKINKTTVAPASSQSELYMLNNKNQNFVTIDSRDRNYNLYPSISNYKIQLPKIYRKVERFELLFSYLPNSFYNINNHNNILYFNEELNIDSKNMLTIDIPSGNYPKDLINNNPQDLLAKTIQEKLNQKGNANYTVTYSELKNNYIIESDLFDQNTNIPTGFSISCKGKEIPIGDFSYEKVPKRNLDNTIMTNSKGEIIYEDVFIGEKVNEYNKNDIGPVVGFDKINYNGLINGKVNNDPNNPNNIIGTDTDFILDLLVDKYILIVNTVPGQPLQLNRYKIVSIISETELELDSPVVPINDALLYKGWIQSSFVRNLEPDKYVALCLPHENDILSRIDSTNTHIQDSFGIIPITNCYKQPWPDEKRFFVDFKQHYPDIDELTIQFKNYNGDFVDFNGMDHVLVFSIITLNNNNTHLIS